MIRVSSPEIREGRSTATSADGQFEFKDLPAGRYTVNAAKGGYVSLSYGQTRPFEGGRPVALGENQTIEKTRHQPATRLDHHGPRRRRIRRARGRRDRDPDASSNTCRAVDE